MTSKSASQARPPTQPGDGIKETFESIVIAFVLAFTFRAYVVEAFVIPTGSMAPTLLGQHMRVQCEQCGYRFETDGVRKSGSQRTTLSALKTAQKVVCPMCHFPNILKSGTNPRAGDRILVHKFVYSFTEPYRWDVVVFKNPDNPDDNYIKRLAGLPGETLLIVEGNVYVKRTGQDDAHWRIARKTDTDENPHAFKVQRAMWQPIYHSDYIPLDGGKTGGNRDWHFLWQTPWKSATGDWQIDGRRSYRLNSLRGGAIAFDFEHQGPPNHDWYVYNQFLRTQDQPIEDVRIAAAIKPDQKGMSVTLRTTARLAQTAPDAQPILLEARIDEEGIIGLYSENLNSPDQWDELARNIVSPFAPGNYTDVELWYVDQEASLWINGEQVLRHRFDLPWQAVLDRKPLDPKVYPKVEIEIQGSPATLSRVEIDRDVSYTTRNPSDRRRQGTMVKDDDDSDSAPIEILPDQYFCLGDNSPLSHDGRFWESADPWVEKMMLPDEEHRYGVVPARLLIGRAFFVYFPAPYPLNDNGLGFVPNFGRMRFIR